MPKTPKLREFLARLKDFGVIPYPNPARGKGSELVVYRPESLGSNKGSIFALTNHGMGRDVTPGQFSARLRRFGIDKGEFLKGL